MDYKKAIIDLINMTDDDDTLCKIYVYTWLRISKLQEQNSDNNREEQN